MPALAKIAPHLWYAKEAEEAAAFYASIFPDSRIDRVTTLPSDSPAGPAGSVRMVELTLFGQRFTAISAGPPPNNGAFNHAISLMVYCDDQAELDRYWDALATNGGQIEECGWVRDRYGLAWQIAPAQLADLLAHPDREKAGRVAAAMLKMKKLELATLQAAFDGK